MKFPTQDKSVIIAIKGLPYTGNNDVGAQISGWAKSPLFWPSLILMELHEQRGYHTNCRPSKEEDDHLHRLAFIRLGRAARFQLLLPLTKFNCVIIESRLSSTFELDWLVELSTENKKEAPQKLIIIEARMRHKYLWKKAVESETSRYDPWFFPRSWNEVEDAIRDYDAKAWDEHYHLKSSLHPHLKRLVLDPSLDLRSVEIVTSENNNKMSPFAKAIEYLLTDESAPSVVEYRSWRKKLMEGLLTTTPSNMMSSLCSNSSSGDCIFKYKTDVDPTVTCWACEQQVLTKEAYMCVSCKLALHKSCAEFPLADDFDTDPVTLHACKSCKSTVDGDEGNVSGGFTNECGACQFETHLKCRLVPTVFDDTNLHPHSLSIQFFPDEQDYYTCELCSIIGEYCGYYCVICNAYYHVRCAHSPAQAEHEHGGYRHLMKRFMPSDTSNSPDWLAFPHDDYLDPEDLWCDVCYRDINSQAGFYVCQDCPDYVAHIVCISETWQGFSLPN